MFRSFVSFLLCLQLISIFSVNIFANTVDDIRDLLGQERYDDTFTKEEINLVIKQYEMMEKANIHVKMYEIGKEIDIDSEVKAEYDRLEKELEVASDTLANNFMGGEPLDLVLKNKSKLETVLFEIDSLRDLGFNIDVEYVSNIWSDKFEEVQEFIKEMSEVQEIGEVGKDMDVPFNGTFVIYSPYGMRLNKITYDNVEMHHGIDFDVPIGTQVMAQWNGVVSKIYKTETGGNTVEITHHKNLKTVYSHLGGIKVKVGQEVKQYEMIGVTGETGVMAQPHLHFAVYLDGESINPIYLYGLEGLNAMKTYVSVYPANNTIVKEIEANLKLTPSKVKEEENNYREAQTSLVVGANSNTSGYNRNDLFAGLSKFGQEHLTDEEKMEHKEKEKLYSRQNKNIEDTSSLSEKTDEGVIESADTGEVENTEPVVE